MKKLSFIAFVLLLASAVATATGPGPKERSIGFSTALPDHKFHLGTEKAVQVVKDLDKAWAARDYKAMRSFFADTAKAYFPDGSVAKSADDFVDKIKSQMEGSEVSWTFDYVYSVDLDPTRGGEHVQAGFTGTDVKDGVTSKTSYHEWYYIIEGKVVMWRQYTMKIKEK
jgi:hypothetical protein